MAINAQTIKVAGVSLLLVSTSLLGFLRPWEGEVNTVYPDKLAAGLPTVCAGITKHVTDELIVIGDYWPTLKCHEIETLVLAKTQARLATCITRPIVQSTFDALTSMAHNLGVGAVCASRAVGLINAGRVLEGCRAIAQAPDGRPVWSYVKGKGGQPVFIKGLYNRRVAEWNLCLRGVV